jgi:hypothetical protein
MHRVSLDASPTAVSEAEVMAHEMLTGTLSSAVVFESLVLFFTMSLTAE